MNKLNNNAGVGSGGFRIVWLVPLEAIMYGGMFTLGLKYGFAVAIPLVGIPAYILLKKIATHQVKAPTTVKHVATPKKLLSLHNSTLNLNLKHI